MQSSSPLAPVLRHAIGPSVRSRLVLMALSLVIPAVILMGILTANAYRESQARYEQQLLATTRALAVATDRQISQGVATLETLALSPALQDGDFAAFERQARETVQDRAAWILLVDEQRQVINTRAAPGAALPRQNRGEAAWKALHEGRTTVSNLVMGQVVSRPIVAIDMPVVVDGKLYSLSLIQEPSAFESIFRSQQLSRTWTGAILDREARLVARSQDGARLRGRTASRDLRAAMARASEGVTLSHTLTGVPTLSGFSRSPNYGWTFVVGVPRTEVYAAVTQSVIGLSAATGLLLVLGVLLAIGFSVQISRQVRSLAADAALIAENRIVETRPDDLTETAQVREALHQASLALRMREEEQTAAAARQEVMINELNHRVKNTLAMIQSLARQSFSTSSPAALETFTERLVALSRAHDLLTERTWLNADLCEIVERTLGPYGERARFSGPPLSLTPNSAVTVSMILHELATNAAKYGALLTPDGVVEVMWTLDGGHSLTLIWRERGGPEVQPPERDGFGSRLITASVQHEFGGQVQMDHLPQGLVCTIVIPLTPRLTG
ncbi:MAG: HWE histidine kinase domain-containing protein [Caulobacter sp.]|nr:HWE histidine kinase domain-containing protein [Caulobacter sp.]